LFPLRLLEFLPLLRGCHDESGFDWGPVNFQAFVCATSEFTSTVWGNPGDQRNLNWGDGTAVDITIGEDGYVTLSHTYAQVGTYVARLTGSTSGEYPTNEGLLMYADTPTAVPYVTVPAIIVAAGQSFNLTVDCHNFTPSDSGNPVAFVDFHDGSGPQPATLTSGGSGTVSLTVPHAPAAGIYNASINFVDADYWRLVSIGAVKRGRTWFFVGAMIRARTWFFIARRTRYLPSLHQYDPKRLCRKPDQISIILCVIALSSRSRQRLQ
jgi:hypothetical protein